MKDSRVKWIGEIPEHWRVSPMKNFMSFINGYAFKSSDLLTEGKYPVIKIGDFNINGIDFRNANYCNIDYEILKNYSIKKEDILIAMSGGTVGKIVYVNDTVEDAFINQRVGIIRATNSKFIYYVLSTGEFLKYVYLLAGGTAQPNISTNSINKYKFAIPGIEEQRKIVNLLDGKTYQVNSIIKNTKVSIEEIKRYKQSVITEAITKGLNHKVDMKETDVDWIGKVPVHWNAMKTKYIFKVEKRIANEEGHVILSVTQKGLKVRDISKNEGQISADYSKYQFVNVGDFVMNHMDLLTGWVDHSKLEGVTSPDYRVFKFINDSNYSADYYKYIFQMCYSNKIFYGMGQGVSNLGRWRLQTDKFINFVLPVPSLEEQNEIVLFLNSKCAHIDSLIEQKRKLINELENYKSSLIFEYVTGKKEVL